jgi:hypothetical protein
MGLGKVIDFQFAQIFLVEKVGMTISKLCYVLELKPDFPPSFQKQFHRTDFCFWQYERIDINKRREPMGTTEKCQGRFQLREITMG